MNIALYIYVQYECNSERQISCFLLYVESRYNFVYVCHGNRKVTVRRQEEFQRVEIVELNDNGLFMPQKHELLFGKGKGIENQEEQRMGGGSEGGQMVTQYNYENIIVTQISFYAFQKNN